MERVQKLLARAGLGSRREIEGWIRAGQVRANGAMAALGAQVSAGDRIVVRGFHYLVTEGESRHRTLLYHKPEGEITSRDDPEHRASLFDHLPRLNRARWVAVGRLDINTSGLILLTTDGELAHQLMHPSSEIEREYAVRVFGEASQEQLNALRAGVELEDDGPANFDQIRHIGGQGRNHWYHVILHGGRNREVRRLWQTQGLTVSRLSRVRYGCIYLPKWLKPGRWTDLSPEQLAKLTANLTVRSTRQLQLKASKPRRGAR